MLNDLRYFLATTVNKSPQNTTFNKNHKKLVLQMSEIQACLDEGTVYKQTFNSSSPIKHQFNASAWNTNMAVQRLGFLRRDEQSSNTDQWVRRTNRFILLHMLLYFSFINIFMISVDTLYLKDENSSHILSTSVPPPMKDAEVESHNPTIANQL